MNAQHPTNPRKKQSQTARLTPAVTPVLESLEARTLMAVTAPTGLTVAPVSASQLSLAWVDRASNETHYVIDRALGSGTFKPIASLPADANSYSDAGLAPGTKYRYRVRAATDTALSMGVTAAGTTANWAVQTSAQSNRVNLNWTDYWTDETSFIVDRATGSGTFKRIATLPANTTTFSDTTVNQSTSYTYQVTAVSGSRKYKPGRGTATTPSAAPVPTAVPPVAPAGLAARASSFARVDLSWADTSSDEDGFKVEQCADGVTWKQVALLGAGATGYTDDGLSPDTGYQFRVRSYNVAGDSAYSNIAAAVTPDVAPAAPSGLAATVVSGAQINLSWADNSDNETSMGVEFSTDGATWANIGVLNADVTARSVVGLSPSMQYQFRVYAANGAGASYSNVVSATTGPAPVTVPAAPSGLAGTVVSSTQVDLTWADVSGNETSMGVELSTDGVNWANIAVLVAGTTARSVAGLAPSTLYRFRVYAANGAGASYSNVVSATTAASPVTIPAAPSSLTATAAASSRINLAWADNSGNESGFKVESSADGVNFTQVGTVASNVTTYAATGLAAATQYTFRVRAYNAAGDSGNTNAASATTQAVAPAAPSALAAAVVSASQVDLSWADNSTNETGFKVERSTDGVNFTQVATVASNITTYSATALTSGTTYTFRVRAYNGVGNSAYSNTASATTPATPPAAPSGLTATNASASRVDVAWADNSGNETGFKVERSTDGTNWTQVGTTSANVTTFAATGLAASTTYQFRVRATNSAGDSGYSNSFSANTLALPTPPAAPSSLAATAASASQVNLTWADGSTDETGFKVERSTDGENFTQVATVGANVTTYAATGLAASTAYTFRVRAYNAAGDSAYSNAAGATTQAGTAVPMPDASNTGLAVTGRAESSLRVISGSYTAKPGEVLDGVNLTGGIIIPAGADNVVIRNSLISGGYYGVQSIDGAKNLLVENTEVRGTDGKGMLVHHATVRRCYFHDVGSDGMFIHEGGDMLIEYNFITRCGFNNPVDHTDGIQVHNGGSNIVIRYNHIVLPSSAYNGGWAGTWGSLNSCVTFQSDWGAISDSSITNNWLDGGGYTIRLEERNGYDISNITVSGNSFTHDYDYGPFRTAETPSYTFTGNFYSDTGQPIVD
jgi:hypothetical protein